MAIVIRAGLALLFVTAAIGKVRSPATYLAAVRGYALLPERMVVPVAFGLLALEMFAAVGALLGHPVALFTMAGLLTLYAAAVGVNLARGRRDIDCGCGGAEPRPLSLFLAARNVLLALLALLATLPVAPRTLGVLDACVIAGAVLTAAFVYAASERLAGSAPRLEALRRG